MSSYEEYVELAEKLLEQNEKYNTRRTKVMSKNIRKTIEAMGKLKVAAKRELIENDNGGKGNESPSE